MTESNGEVRPSFWDCINILDRWYRDGVAEVADEYIAQTEERIDALRKAWAQSPTECINRGFNPADDDGFDEEEVAEEVREEMDTWLHESIDGHQFIIYTAMANAVILVSNNDDAYENEIGGYASTEVRAFFAMRQDVAERIEL